MKRPRTYGGISAKRNHLESSSKVLWIVCVLLCCLPRSSLAFQSGFLPASALDTVPLLSDRSLLEKHKLPQRRSLALHILQVSKQKYNNPKANYKGNNNNNNNKSNRNSNRRYNNNNNSQAFQQSRVVNGKVTACDSAKEILQLLASLKGAMTLPAGGGTLNSVNFSTAIHRIARHVNQFDRNGPPEEQPDFKRRETFKDPRFALFLCSLAEALGGVSYDPKTRATVSFGSREVSNIAWALAKLKIVPPSEDSPLLSTSNYKTMLLDTAKQLRGQVMQVAKARAQSTSSSEVPTDASMWVRTAALLCGQMMDMIGILVAQAMTTQHTNSNSNNNKINHNTDAIQIHKMAFQERANLLWACATAQRGSDNVFNEIMKPMVKDMKAQLADDNMKTIRIDKNNPQNSRRGKDASALQPQEWSNSIWAFAVSGVFGDGQVQLVEFVASAMEEQEGFREMFKPQELSNTAYAVAKLLSKKKDLEEGEEKAAIVILRNVAMEVTKRAGDFKTQELSNTLWAFATLGFGSSASSTFSEIAASLNDYVILSSDDPEGDERIVRQATDAILQVAIPQINRFKSQELNNLAWALARLGRKDSTAVLEAIGRQLCHPKRRVTSQDIGTSLWSMANLEFCDEEVFRGVASRLRIDRAHEFKPQELSNAVWAMATIEITPKYPDIFDTVLIPPKEQFSGSLRSIDDPITVAFGIAAQELMRRPFDFKSQEIKDILWSFSRIGIRHPDLFKATAEHLVGPDKPKGGTRARPRGLDDFSPQGLGNTAWAFARQAQLVADVNERSSVSASVLSKTGKMAVYATSFFDIGEILVHRLFSAIADTDLRIHQNLSTLKPQDISNTVWAMSVLGMRHAAFLEAAKEQLIKRTEQYVKNGPNSMTNFKSQELANVLWAFAIVNFPFPDLEETVVPYMLKSTVGSMANLNAEDIAKVYKRQEIANIAWSCAVFSDYAPNLTKLLYSGLVGLDNDRDPQYLNNCYKDGGLQREAIMSLIYLQTAMEVEGKANGLFLPESFPEGWGRQTRSKDDTLNDMGFDLKLSTSKIQRDVSVAFDRIGFQHVEEHVIPLEELLENQGVGLAPTPIDVISIDLANVEDRIAIEVDGPAHYVADIETVPAEGGVPKVNNGRLEYSFKMSSERHSLNGPTALKIRLLEQMGWKVINIPFWEWYALNGDEGLEEEYCRRVLGD